MIEDPALFLPFGIHPLWLRGPRPLAAVIAVYLASAWFAVRRRWRRPPTAPADRQSRLMRVL